MLAPPMPRAAGAPYGEADDHQYREPPGPLFGRSKPAANGGHLPKTWNSRDTAAKWAVFGASNPPGWIGYWLTVEKTSRNSLGRNSNDVWQR